MITLSVGRKDLCPFETVSGRVEWHLEAAPKDLELRLCWFTRGRGTEESETVEALALGDTADGAREFSFVLPGEPWSVDGRLISIAWALVIDGENHLSWRRRRELRRAARAARGVLVARHGRGGWPELIRLRSAPAQAALLLARAAPEWAGRFVPEAELRWQSSRGNLRELLLGCYDELAAGKKTFE